MLILAGSPAGAQPPDEFAPVRFTVFAARPVPGMSFVPRADAGPEKLEFYPTARSPRYEYRGPMPLSFIGATGGVVAEAGIPRDMSDVLLLFMPIGTTAAQGALKYRIAVIDDSAARHRAGGLVIIDLSGLSLGGTVNRERVTLRPGMNPPLAVGSNVQVMLRTMFKGRSYQAYANSFELRPGERALLILFPPFYPGSLEVQSRLLRDDVAQR